MGDRIKKEKYKFILLNRLIYISKKLFFGFSKLINNFGYYVFKVVFLFNRDVILLFRRNFLEELNMYRRKIKNYFNCLIKLIKKYYR